MVESTMLIGMNINQNRELLKYLRVNYILECGITECNSVQSPSKTLLPIMAMLYPKTTVSKPTTTSKP